MLLALVTQQFGQVYFLVLRDTAAQTCLLCLDRPIELYGVAVPALLAMRYAARIHVALYSNQVKMNSLSSRLSISS